MYIQYCLCILGPPATPKNMSMHEEPSPYWSVSEEVEVPVVNPVDGVEVLVGQCTTNISIFHLKTLDIEICYLHGTFQASK